MSRADLAHLADLARQAAAAAVLLALGYGPAREAARHPPRLDHGDQPMTTTPHHCMTDPASKIPAAMALPDPGPVEDGPTVLCAVCRTAYVLRESVGFVCWQAVEPAPAERAHPFPGNVLVHVQGMNEGGSDEESPDQARGELRTPTADLDHAMIVTSAAYERDVMRQSPDGWVVERVRMHRPVLDLDMPARLVESSTRGHYHLMIDHAMTWDRYVALLDALVAAGLVESGYVSAAKERGHTGVRVPWLRKGDPAPPPPPGAELLADPAPAAAHAEPVGLDVRRAS